MILVLSILLNSICSLANDLPKIKIAELNVPPGNIFAIPSESPDIIEFANGDHAVYMRQIGRSVDGREYDWVVIREVHNGSRSLKNISKPQVPKPTPPGDAKAPGDSPGNSTTGKIAAGVGITIFIYEVFDQTTRTASEMNDAAKRLRQMADHGVRVGIANAAEQRRLAAELDRSSGQRMSRSLTNAGLMSSRLKLKSDYVPPEQPADPDVLCRDGGARPDFVRAMNVGDGARLTQYVSAALATEDSVCRTLIPDVVNADYVLNTHKIDPLLPDSPLDDQAFQVPPTSDVGRQLRTLANEYQANWIAKGGYHYEPSRREFFMSGASLLGAADDAYVRGQFEQGRALQNASSVTLQILEGARDGAVEAVTELYQTLPVIADALKSVVKTGLHDPASVAQAAQRTIAGIPNVAESMLADAIEQWDVLKNGTAYDRSRFLGKQITLHASSILGGRVLKAVGSGVGMATTAVRASVVEGRMTAKLARYGEHIRGQWMAPLIDEAKVASLAAKLYEGEKILKANGTSLSTNARNYLASHLAGEGVGQAEVTIENLVTKGEQYVALESKMTHVPLTEFEGEITRAVPKEFHLPVPGSAAPVIFEATEQNVMAFTENSYTARNRFGRMGEMELYATVGTEAAVKDVLVLETGKAAEELVFATQRVSIEKVLDLTDRKVLSSLGLHGEQLVQSSYELTQALGHLARAQKIEGILFKSAQKSSFTNMVRF